VHSKPRTFVRGGKWKKTTYWLDKLDGAGSTRIFWSSILPQHVSRSFLAVAEHFSFIGGNKSTFRTLGFLNLGGSSRSCWVRCKFYCAKPWKVAYLQASVAMLPCLDFVLSLSDGAFQINYCRPKGCRQTALRKWRSTNANSWIIKNLTVEIDTGFQDFVKA